MVVLDAIVALFVLVGAFFTLAGSIGLARFPDFYTRLHGPTKATTLGVGGLLVASAVYFTGHAEGVSVNEILIMLFLFMTAPVSAHVMAKAALHLRVPARPRRPSKRLRGAGWTGAERPADAPKAPGARGARGARR